MSSDTHSAKRERAKAEGALERRVSVSSPSGLECRAALWRERAWWQLSERTSAQARRGQEVLIFLWQAMASEGVGGPERERAEFQAEVRVD